MTWRQGDGETGRQGDLETGRQGDRETGNKVVSIPLLSLESKESSTYV